MTTGRINQVASHPSIIGGRLVEPPLRERAALARFATERTTGRASALATDRPAAAAHALCAETTATNALDAIGLVPRERGPTVETTRPRETCFRRERRRQRQTRASERTDSCARSAMASAPGSRYITSHSERANEWGGTNRPTDLPSRRTTNEHALPPPPTRAARAHADTTLTHTDHQEH